MRWFKHDTDARKNPKLRYIGKELGEAGYARAFQLLEIVAQRGGKADEFRPEIDLGQTCTDLDWLADELGISRPNTRKTLKIFAQCKFIDPKAYERNIISVPQMTQCLDEWTARRLRSNSRAGGADSQSDSGQPHAV
jgi:hypothetical protein